MDCTIKALLESASKHGYLTAPRDVLEAALTGNEQARVLLILLLKVNFADREAVSGERRYLCRRGESILSLNQWSQQTGLPVPALKDYFKAFLDAGILEPVDNPLHGGHIRLARYNELTSKAHAAGNKSAATAGDDPCAVKDKRFDAFWKFYHKITGRTQEQSLTRIYWNRLTLEEQALAYDILKVIR
jgi:hypothetical protein